jgi:hypothetical protein
LFCQCYKISLSEIRELLSAGLITRTDHVHPRYTIVKSKIDSLSTGCGEDKLGRVDFDENVDKITSVLSSFNLGKVLNGQANIINKYGEDN